jgi:hypothetical protein
VLADNAVELELSSVVELLVTELEPAVFCVAVESTANADTWPRLRTRSTPQATLAKYFLI